MLLAVTTGAKHHVMTCRSGWRNVAAKLQAHGWPDQVALKASQAYKAGFSAYSEFFKGVNYRADFEV